MKFKNEIFTCLIMVVVSLGSLQSNNQTIPGNQHINKRSVEEEAFSIVDYLSLFIKAEEQYLQKNKFEPKIRCKKCTTKQLGMGEFGGGLVGVALKDIVDGKGNFGQLKLILDSYLDVLSRGSHSDMVDYMIRIANETKQACSHCYDHSTSWAKID